MMGDLGIVGGEMHTALRCCRRMHEELKGVGGSGRLAAQVAACMGKALRLLTEKAEYMAATGTPCCLVSSCPLHSA